MALHSAAQTRVDQLADKLGMAQRQTVAPIKPVDPRPYFQVHKDGSVYTRDGVELRGPRTPLHQK
jgi:hypothetical protein